MGFDPVNEILIGPFLSFCTLTNHSTCSIFNFHSPNNYAISQSSSSEASDACDYPGGNHSGTVAKQCPRHATGMRHSAHRSSQKRSCVGNAWSLPANDLTYSSFYTHQGPRQATSTHVFAHLNYAYIDILIKVLYVQ